LQLDDELFQLRALALRHDFDPPIVQVADPTGQREGLSLFQDEETETDSLDAAADEGM
jgi:hypothetical protein